MSDLITTRQPEIKPVHILAGLGRAERDLLTTCLALLDDSALTGRLAHLYENAKDKGRRLTKREADEAEQELRNSLSRWKTSPWDDNDLRIILWARLRDAMGLPPRLSATTRGCSHLADDLAAQLIHVLDPPGLRKSGKRWLRKKRWLEEGEQAVSLGDIVLPVLDELLENSPAAEQFPSEPHARRQALSEAVGVMARLTEEEQAQLVEGLEADKLNDEALWKTLVVGGSLGAFGVGVSSAGFSAYILAAQASSFVPLVSGPGLVSFVSVLSNPITIVGSTAAVGWWAVQSAKRKIRANVAARIIAMLTIRGLQAGPGGLDALRTAFVQLPRRNDYEAVPRALVQSYRQEWDLLNPVWKKQATSPSNGVLAVMERPVDVSAPGLGLSFGSGGGTTGNERANAAALATMTVGDVLYSVAAVDPTVIQAADFSRLADIDGRVAFSELAKDLMDGSDPAVQGGISQLKGYVAERAVAADLTAAGNAVSFPETPNAAGWDLMVDGERFQVKFHEGLEGIREHFERYDYPVFANSELQGKIPEELQESVFFVDGLNNEVVTHVTEESLEAGEEMMDAGAPAMVGLVSAARAIMAYRSGEITRRQGFEQLLADGAVRVGLFGAGGVVGTTTGMALFGPAGAWVLGPGLSILAQMQTPRAKRALRNWVKTKDQKQWEADTHERLDRLTASIRKALDEREKQFARKRGCLPDHEVGQYLDSRLGDAHCFATECLLRLELLNHREWPVPEQRAVEIFRLLTVSAVHPAVYQAEMRAVTELLGQRPGLTDFLNKESMGAAWDTAQQGAKRGTESARETLKESGVTDWARDTLKGFNWPGSKRDPK